MQSLAVSSWYTVPTCAAWVTLSLLCSTTSLFSSAFVATPNHHHVWPPACSLLKHEVATTTSLAAARISKADEERLLMGQVGLTAFIVAEMQHFLNSTMVEFDKGLRYGVKWEMSVSEKLIMGLLLKVDKDKDKDSNDSDGTAVVASDEYAAAVARFQGTKGGQEAVDALCRTTQVAFGDGFESQGLLSALGSAIIFFRSYYRANATLVAACERVGLSDYDVSHHISDMYHHRTFRGAYTKTLTPSGVGEVAARRAVGLQVKDDTKVGEGTKTNVGKNVPGKGAPNDNELARENHDPDDECLLWSPTTPGVCLHWKSDDEAWRTKRFERIQMEGTRDPRRGGSGTTR